MAESPLPHSTSTVRPGVGVDTTAEKAVLDFSGTHHADRAVSPQATIKDFTIVPHPKDKTHEAKKATFRVTVPDRTVNRSGCTTTRPGWARRRITVNYGRHAPTVSGVGSFLFTTTGIIENRPTLPHGPGGPILDLLLPFACSSAAVAALLGVTTLTLATSRRAALVD